VFPALTARDLLPNIIPCMLINVSTTFRVDWYVFILVTSVERSSCCCRVAAAIVVASVRAVLKIIGYGFEKTCL
jgi:hypothetical protein